MPVQQSQLLRFPSIFPCRRPPHSVLCSEISCGRSTWFDDSRIGSPKSRGEAFWYCIRGRRFIQRACAPGPKCELAEFLEASVARVSCLPAAAFSGQAFHCVAQQVTDEQLEQVQVAIAKAAVARFELSTDVLAFDTTNFDTHIATLTAGQLARRGHAKSKRNDLRVVGLGLLVSETEHVPLLYRNPGNGSAQGVLTACLEELRKLHEALDEAEGRAQPGQRTLVRDRGFWSPQLERSWSWTWPVTTASSPCRSVTLPQSRRCRWRRAAAR